MEINNEILNDNFNNGTKNKRQKRSANIKKKIKRNLL